MPTSCGGKVCSPKWTFTWPKNLDSPQLWHTFAWAASKSMQQASSSSSKDAKGGSNPVNVHRTWFNDFAASLKTFLPRHLELSLAGALLWLLVAHIWRTSYPHIVIFSNLCPSARGAAKGQRMQVELNSFFAAVDVDSKLHWWSRAKLSCSRSSFSACSCSCHWPFNVAALALMFIHCVLSMSCGHRQHNVPCIQHPPSSIGLSIHGGACKSWAFKGII